MPARSLYEYVIIRVIPLVERGECLNAGVVLFCRTRRFLDARVELDEPRLAALAPGVDPRPIRQQLDSIALVCAGGADAGPIGLLPQTERFGWLAAPRSTVIQASPVHCGMCADPAATLDRLLTLLVRAPHSGR
jgi:hypothetical protein